MLVAGDMLGWGDMCEWDMGEGAMACWDMGDWGTMWGDWGTVLKGEFVFILLVPGGICCPLGGWCWPGGRAC